MQRRGFLKLLGIGAAATQISPVVAKPEPQIAPEPLYINASEKYVLSPSKMTCSAYTSTTIAHYGDYSCMVEFDDY